MAEYKVVDAEQLDADLTEIADEVRALTDTSDTMTIDEITSNIAQANTDISTQADLIAQIQTALEGKAGSSAEEICILIDQSGVLDSTDETVTEKVEQLIDKAGILKKSRGVLISNDASFSTITLDCANFTTLNGCFSGCVNLRSIYLSNTQNVTDWRNFLYTTNYLHTIETLDLSSMQYWSIQEVGALKNIKFKSNTIKKSITIPSAVLSGESIQSTIDGLNSEVTGQTLTIPRKAVKKAFETSEGANDGDTSETWNALVASKPNWTITLS